MGAGGELLRHPLLLADIGGTNVRLALERSPAGPIESLARLKTRDYAAFEDVARQTLLQAGVMPRSAAICGAGPVIDGRIALTNGAWLIDPVRIAEALGLMDCLLVNDLEALALGIARHGTAGHVPIGAPRSAPGGVRLVVGIGTGFGTAALIESPEGAIAISSEAGQIGLGPIGAQETALWPHIEPGDGRISIESLLSGPGFLRLSGALRRRHGLSAEERPPEEIVQASLGRMDAAAAETLDVFVRLLGRVTGDLALAFKATGGVFLAGGFLTAISSGLDEDAFRAAFEAKGAFRELMQAIPTSLVTGDGIALSGLSAAAGRRHGG
jgi:glucokinase